MQQCSAVQSRYDGLLQTILPYRFAADICGVARRNEVHAIPTMRKG